VSVAAAPILLDPRAIDFLNALPLTLLARAEVNHDLRGDRFAVNLYALAPEDFEAICALRPDGGAALRASDARMRRSFVVAPRHWVKVSPLDPQALSEYHQLIDANPTAIRLFLRSHGAEAAVAAVQGAFAQTFTHPDLQWGLVLKHGANGTQPRLSVRLPSSQVARTLGELVRHDLLSVALAQALRDGVRALGSAPTTYLSLDPLTPDAVALDVPTPDPRLLEQASGVSLAGLEAGDLSYAKLRFPDGPQRPPRFTVYRPALEAFGEASGAERLARVRRYYDLATPMIERTFGGTYQAGLYQRSGEGYDAAGSTVALMQRAGLTADTTAHLLDLGCGLAGPAIDIATAHPQVRITGINLSPVQVERARARVAAAGLSERITIVHGDFHALPFPAASFDGVIAFEALGYAVDLAAVYREARRVLVPGGWLYAKEVVREAGDLHPTARENLAAFDRSYATRTPTLAQHTEALAVGWRIERCGSIDDETHTDAYQRAMFDLGRSGTPSFLGPSRPRLSEFGRLHYFEHETLPLYFAEILATPVGDPPTAAADRSDP
jgi:SAM-dependent methyltransferase